MGLGRSKDAGLASNLRYATKRPPSEADSVAGPSFCFRCTAALSCGSYFLTQRCDAVQRRYSKTARRQLRSTIRTAPPLFQHPPSPFGRPMRHQLCDQALRSTVHPRRYPREPKSFYRDVPSYQTALRKKFTANRRTGLLVPKTESVLAVQSQQKIRHQNCRDVTHRQKSDADLRPHTGLIHSMIKRGCSVAASVLRVDSTLSMPQIGEMLFHPPLRANEVQQVDAAALAMWS